MVKADWKGVAKVTSPAGRTYWYAWRGGPRLDGVPGSIEFDQSYRAAHDDLRKPDDGKFRSLVVLYKGSPAYRDLADSTKRNWATWLDRLSQHFGPLSLAQFSRFNQIQPVIRRWRAKYADRPRTADYGMQVLSRVLGYAVEEGRLVVNACEGIKPLYSTNRSDIIWTADDIGTLKQSCSAEVACAVDLAAHTGLRLGDLMRLSWSHVGGDAIVIRTGKSGGKREAIIPLYDALRAVLAAIPKRATTILTSGKWRPWTVNGFGSSFNKAKITAGMADANLHFHDLRGTAVTKFYLANVPVRAIAEIMAWEEDSVERIIRRYVDRSAATRALIAQINGAGK
jgi:integrase